MILDLIRTVGARLASLGTPPTLAGVTGPRPGDLVVYGWRGGKPGHVGLLSYVPGVDAADPPSVVEARRWIGQGEYRLGAGGRRPEDGTPFDAEGRCDCSGFVCHCLGIDRRAVDGWINTTAIVRDAETPGGRFDAIALAGVDLRRCRVIHCRGGKPPAVVETDAGLWARRGGIVVRYVGG